MDICPDMLRVQCPFCTDSPCTCQTLTRSRSYHGHRHRRGQNTKSVLVNGTGQQRPSPSQHRRNSLPESLKLVLLDPGRKLPTLAEPPPSPTPPSPANEAEKRLRTKLQQLLKAMLALRQTDIALLKQLWSLSDQLYDADDTSSSCSSLPQSLDYTHSPSLASRSLDSRDDCYSSHESFEFDEDEATSIPIVHLDPS